MRIVALTGHKQSGKDTVAGVLETMGFQRIAFADPLKAVASSIGWDGTKDDYEPCDCCGMLQGRRLLQTLGTEGLRDNLWRSILIDTLVRRIDGRTNYVISDLRFPDEASAIRHWGGEIWRVKRPGYEGDGHSTERLIDEIVPHLTIVNAGPVTALERRVRQVINERQLCTA